MANAKTREEFMDLMDNAEGCYVYFVDKDERMHFVSDYPYKGRFCDSMANALLLTEDEAIVMRRICKLLYPANIYQIVKIHSNVEWL